jgi:hypothetical protein
MATGCDKVVVSGARASCAMSLHSILARMASRGAARRAHSTQMRRIAVLPGLGGSTGAITCLSSARRCFLWFPPGATYPWPTPAWAMTNPLIPRLAPWLTPILQLAPPTKSGVAPWPAPFPPTLRCVPPLFGNNACWQELSPPTLQGDPPTLGNFVPRPTPALPTLQHLQPTLGNIATWRCWPTLFLARPPHGNVAPWSTPFLPKLQTLPTPPTPFLRLNLLPSSMAPQTKSDTVPRQILTPPTPQRVRPTLSVVTCWPHWPMLSPVRPPRGNVPWWPSLPKPLLALWLPVDAASPQAPCASSSSAHIANVQERPYVVVAAKSGGQARHGGGGGEAIGRWFGGPPSIMQEQCVWP